MPDRLSSRLFCSSLFITNLLSVVFRGYCHPLSQIPHSLSHIDFLSSNSLPETVMSAPQIHRYPSIPVHVYPGSGEFITLHDFSKGGEPSSGLQEKKIVLSPLARSSTVQVAALFGVLSQVYVSEWETCHVPAIKPVISIEIKSVRGIVPYLLMISRKGLYLIFICQLLQHLYHIVI